MNLSLQNKIIPVSYGAKGTGQAITKLLAAEGAIPVIIGSNEEDNLKTVDEIKSAGGQCAYIVAELTNTDECKNAIDQVMQSFGRIDGLVNNADINGEIESGQNEYVKFVESLYKNLVPYYLLAHYALPALKISKGAIVNIASQTTDSGGKNALAREWSVELLKYSIRVNAVVADNHTTTADEIANMVAFLLSERASHTTGQIIHLDRALANA